MNYNTKNKRIQHKKKKLIMIKIMNNKIKINKIIYK
jgi:hypothetical protein